MSWDRLSRIASGVNPEQLHAETVNGSDPLSVADAVFLNEADNTLPEFIEFLSGKRSESDIHGIAFKVNNNINTIPYKTYPDFQNLPMPAWDMIDIKNYYKVTSVCGLRNVIEDVAPSAIIQTVRGCVAKCTFCSVRNFNGFGVRARNPENVLDELEILVKDYGIKYIEIVDDDQNIDRRDAVVPVDVWHRCDRPFDSLGREFPYSVGVDVVNDHQDVLGIHCAVIIHIHRGLAVVEGVGRVNSDRDTCRGTGSHGILGTVIKTVTTIEAHFRCVLERTIAVECQ